MAALADVAPYGADLIGTAFFPRLRRGLHDCARFAGFSTGNRFKLALMGILPAQSWRERDAPAPAGKMPALHRTADACFLGVCDLPEGPGGPPSRVYSPAPCPPSPVLSPGELQFITISTYRRMPYLDKGRYRLV